VVWSVLEAPSRHSFVVLAPGDDPRTPDVVGSAPHAPLPVSVLGFVLVVGL
jgi:hypothetical protein